MSAVPGVLAFLLLCVAAASSVWASTELFVELPGTFGTHLSHSLADGARPAQDRWESQAKMLSETPLLDSVFPPMSAMSYGVPTPEAPAPPIASSSPSSVA